MSEYIHMTEPITAETPSTVDLPELDIYGTLVLLADIIDTGKVKMQLPNSDLLREAAREIARLRENKNTIDMVVTTSEGTVYTYGNGGGGLPK